MSKGALQAGFCASALVILPACHDSGGGPPDVVSPPATTQMTLSPSTTTEAPGNAVNFTIAAANPQLLLRSAAIDFNGDGSWDADRDFNDHQITATFSHVYLGTGVFGVRAIVTDENGHATGKTVSVTIAGQPLTQVWWTMLADADPAAGVCYATGPPYAFDTEIMTGQRSQPMGSPGSGTTVSVDQSFSQDGTLPGTATPYKCNFYVKISANTPSGVVVVASGGCQTPVEPGNRLSCRVSISGVIP